MNKDYANMSLKELIIELMESVKVGEGWINPDYVIMSLEMMTGNHYAGQEEEIFKLIDELGYSDLIVKSEE